MGSGAESARAKRQANRRVYPHNYTSNTKRPTFSFEKLGAFFDEGVESNYFPITVFLPFTM